MKKIIIILGCIILGCSIYEMILGDESDSLKNTQKKFFEYEINNYQTYY